MHLNADFNQPALIHFDDQDWQASPMAGVERKMLDRIGDEKARATSLVRYAPGSRFSPHVHTGGEEFLVLDGVFQDEHGDYPAGSYLRNPPQSSHTPGSDPGCIIFVKLWQFDLDDRHDVRVHTDAGHWQPDPDDPAIQVQMLHQDQHETVRLERWPAGHRIDRAICSGLELLLLDGRFDHGHETLRRWSWLRLPASTRLTATADTACEVWTKTGAHRVRDVRG